MATVVRGYSFGATETVTNLKLHTLVDNASISGIVTADISDGAITTAKIVDSNVTMAKLGTGPVIQVVSTETGATATTTAAIPHDDTIPQITEGAEFMTLAITPASATNKLLIQVVFNYSDSATADQGCAALFQDTTANALAAARSNSGAANEQAQVVFNHYMTAGTTSSTTFRVRGGGQGNTMYFNGNSGGRILGGVCASSITIMEIKA